MPNIDYLKCSEEERWEYINQLDKYLVMIKCVKIRYKNIKKILNEYKQSLKSYDKIRLYSDIAEKKYEIILLKYNEMLNEKYECELKLLSINVDDLHEQYRGLIDEKYWNSLGYLLQSYYYGNVETVEEAIKLFEARKRKR